MTSKKKPRAAKKRKDIRTSISLAPVIWDMAAYMMDRKGFNDNFSAYVGDLIRRDKERWEKEKKPAPPTGQHLELSEPRETSPPRTP